MNIPFEQRLQKLPAETQELFLHKLRLCPVEEAYDVLLHAGFGDSFTMSEVLACRASLLQNSPPPQRAQSGGSVLPLNSATTTTPIEDWPPLNPPDIPPGIDLSTDIRRPVRRGKIPSLPPPILEGLNEQLEEGATLKGAVQWLISQGYSGISTENMWHWKHGGFQEWLAQKDSLEHAQALNNWSAAFARDQSPHQLVNAVASFLAARLYGAMRGVDTAVLQSQLRQDPKHFLEYADRLIRAARLTIAVQRQTPATALAETKKAVEDDKKLKSFS